MYSSPVVLLRPATFSAKSEGRVFLFEMTGNKLVEEVIRGVEEGGK